MDGFLEVLCEPAAAAEPSESSLDHPPARQDFEALSLVGTLDDLEGPGADRHRPEIGIGNAVRDLLQAVAAGSDLLSINGTVFTPIETADGTAFDGDDAAAVLNNSSTLVSADGALFEAVLLGTSIHTVPHYF